MHRFAVAFFRIILTAKSFVILPRQPVDSCPIRNERRRSVTFTLPMELTTTPVLPHKEKRRFISETLDFNTWASLEPVYTELRDRPLASAPDFRQWMNDQSELDSAIQEHAGWLYIRMTC